jgi:hypothetical protein
VAPERTKRGQTPFGALLSLMLDTSL